MPTPPMSDNLKREALEALRRYGTQIEAARALGIPRTTFINRLRAASGIDSEEFVPPELIGDDEDLESVIAKLEAEDERREKARA